MAPFHWADEDIYLVASRAYIQLGDMEYARAGLQTLTRLQAVSERRQLQLRLDQAGRQSSVFASNR